MRFITVCLFIIFAQAFFCAAGASEWQASCFRGTALVKETAEGAELYYDFGGNDGSYALCEKKAEGAEGADTLEFTVVKPEDHRVNLRVMDAGGEVFQKPLQLPACPYPLKVRVFLGDYPEHWGGNNDGVFDGAPSAVGFAVLKGMSVSSRGKAVFAGLRFLKAGAPPAPEQRRLEARGKAEKGKAVFTVKVSGDPGPAVLRAVFRNSRGGFEGAEERRILVGKDCCETFAIKTDTFTEGEFYLDGAARFSSEITCGPSADYKRACAVVMPPPFSEEGPAPGPALGMGVYLYRRNDPRDDHKELRQAAELARRCGVRWSREEFTWPAIEKERGKPDFSFYDRMVAEAEKAGINIYGLICYYADWAQPATDDANREFARFAGQLAERYKDKIRFWEIWNEPNGGFYPWDVNKYYGLHKMCYEAIKRVDPSLQVIGCSSAAGSVEFIRGAREAGCVFDIASSHPYRTALVDGLLVRQLEETADAASFSGKPGRVWLTEIGWPTHSGGGQPETRQAEFLARAYMDALSVKGVENVTWYDFIGDGEDENEMEHNFGLLHRDLTPKPAYLAFRTMSEALAGKEYAGALQPGGGVTAYLWKGKGETACLWPGENGFYTFEGGAFLLYNVYGDRLGRTVYLKAGQPVFAAGERLGGLKVRKEGAFIPPSVVRGGSVKLTAPAALVPKSLPECCSFSDGFLRAGKGPSVPGRAVFSAGESDVEIDILPETLILR